VLDGPIGQEILSKFPARNLVALAWGEQGFRHLTNNARAVAAPGDMRGLKLRTMENQVHMTAFRTLGANPTPVAFAELYTALQSGAVDGQDNPLPTSRTMRFHEVTTQFVLTSHLVAYDLLTISSRVWDGLTPAQRQAVQAAADKAIDESTRRHLAQEDEMIAFFRGQGLEVYAPNVDAFRAEAQRRYLASTQSQGWPQGILERIAAVR
jgi:TRAP-type C4-dicarboxylate transport system substrate-binding protein